MQKRRQLKRMILITTLRHMFPTTSPLWISETRATSAQIQTQRPENTSCANNFLNCLQTQIHNNIAKKHEHLKILWLLCFSDCYNLNAPVQYSDFWCLERALGP